MYESRITVEGNLGSDPELKFIPSGKAVCKFSLANTPRRNVGGEWKDQETTWYTVSVWGKEAENVAESLHKGDTVIVVGDILNRTYEVQGQKRTSLELANATVGASLRRGKVTIEKNSASGGGSFSGSQGNGGGYSAPAQDDPFAPMPGNDAAPF